MNIQDKILNDFTNGKLSGKTLNELCAKLSVPRGEKKNFSKILDKLCADGKLCHDDRHRYFTPQQLGAIVGVVQANKGGFAFLLPEDREKYPDDFFIPGRMLGGALNGDKVLCVPHSFRDSKDEVAVIKILERNLKEVVGTYYFSRHGVYVHPDDEKITTDIFIPKGMDNGAKDGMKVVCVITSFPEGKAPSGEIKEVLGEGDDFFVEELSLIRAHGLREEFPVEVATVAKTLPVSVPEKEIKGRKDLRESLIVTVDGEDTRDIDDGISVEKKGNNYLLGVHIADVTAYVPFKGVLDKEAFRRGTSVYFPDRVLPMLPKELSNGICSLNEGVDRLALSVSMEITPQGNVIKREICKSVIRSRHCMNYHQMELLSKDDPTTVAAFPDLVEFTKNAYALTEILQGKRAKNGSVELAVKEVKIYFDKKEKKIIVPPYEHLTSQDMIEQFMVLANESVAEEMTNAHAPFVYRIHEKPKAEKAEDLQAFLLGIGMNCPFDTENASPADYQKILNMAKDTPVYPVVNRVLLRSMMKAKYDSVNVGHFGLASQCYCHFTSPIRRYPDLCIHRIIKLVLDGKKEEAIKLYAPFVSEAAARSSDCERTAVEAERDVDDLYTTMYMSDHIGDVYDGVISGVTDFGVFVELENTIEGMIPFECLPKDDYEFLSEHFALRGRKYVFRIGDEVTIKVVGVDFGNRKTEFSFVKMKKATIQAVNNVV